MSKTLPATLLDSDVVERDWRHYLTRPFSLFGASVWNEWYASEKIREVLGQNLTDAIFVETRSHLVRNYRKADQLVRLQESVDELLGDPPRAFPALEHGMLLNAEAKRKLESGQVVSLQKEVDFMIDIAVHATIIPYFLAETKNEEIVDLCMRLRSESLYPRLMVEILEPLAERMLRDLGLQDVASLITVRELIGENVDSIQERKRKRDEGRMFVYQNRSGKELVEWTENPDELITALEGHGHPDGLRGSVAFSGKASGRARVILTADIEGVEFDEGDILVAVSTSPTLLPLMRKAGAIVTDEGGMMCHAAILARELEIPCIVGMQVATSRIADGDIVEVDADEGCVRVIS